MVKKQSDMELLTFGIFQTRCLMISKKNSNSLNDYHQNVWCNFGHVLNIWFASFFFLFEWIILTFYAKENLYKRYEKSKIKSLDCVFTVLLHVLEDQTFDMKAKKTSKLGFNLANSKCSRNGISRHSTDYCMSNEQQAHMYNSHTMLFG